MSHSLYRYQPLIIMPIKHIPSLTVAILDKLKTPKGGYTRKTLQTLGVGRPPKQGWRKELIRMARANEAAQQMVAQPQELPLTTATSHFGVIKHRLLLLTQEARAHAFKELDTIYCLKCGKMRTDDWPCCVQ